MKRTIRNLLILIMSSFLLFLSGCWDTNEPEQMVYAQGMGVDFKDNRYVLYLQTINLSLLAKSEASGAGAGQAKVEVGYATGKTIDEAIFRYYQISQRRIFFGHLAFLVLTDDALKHGAVKSAVDFLDRYRETRYNIWMYATKSPLKKTLLATPMFEVSNALSRLSDPKVIFKQNSFIPPVDLRELIIHLNEPSHEVNIPLVQTKEHLTTDQKTETAIQVNGAVAITSSELKGVFSENKIKGLRWITDEFVRAGLRVRLPDHSDIDLVVDKKKVKVEPVIKGSNLTFNIKVRAKATILVMPQHEKLSTIKKEAEQKIKKQIIETYAQGLNINSDVYRLSHVLYKKELRKWNAVQSNGAIPLTKDSINVKVNVQVKHGNKQRIGPTID
ncbi:Ger(x)C family spore germination protein [Priestia aryabhattai]|uniref:Ger(x)C family spore germination protein n=1 Tax=Priestia aryabhattai TaxID=412384 RepID=UPI003531CE37